MKYRIPNPYPEAFTAKLIYYTIWIVMMIVGLSGGDI